VILACGFWTHPFEASADSGQFSYWQLEFLSIGFGSLCGKSLWRINGNMDKRSAVATEPIIERQR